ncbi:rifin [Plasmodium sp. gorilla clade G1]|nr:rifin [Plasmodium sp. gorilla clade G1]
MKVHYINILMFALPLNILLYNQRNHKSTTLHTPNENPIKTHRSLCECELYAPQNYDNDPEMKSTMQDFDRQTSQRFREYGERMNKSRQKCKYQCDKDIQKIILKDKIENELKEKLATLETNIYTKDLPICECEKSLTDKVEKGCLGCGVLGNGIAPSVGLFGEVALGAWKTAALVTAKKLAANAGALAGEAAGDAAGAAKVIELLIKNLGVQEIFGKPLGSIIVGKTYTDASNISHVVYTKFHGSCFSFSSGTGAEEPLCNLVSQKAVVAFKVPEIVPGEYVSYKDVISTAVKEIVADAQSAATAKALDVTSTTTATLTTKKTGLVEATYMGYQTTIIVSIVAILVIVLVMIIIYLILRYRRKKKMKKKFQYIKLLKE